MPITTDIMQYPKPNDNEVSWCREIKSLTPKVEEVYYPATISLSGGLCYTHFDIEIPIRKDVPIALCCRNCWKYVEFFRKHSPEGVAIALDGEQISITSPSSSAHDLVNHDCTP